MSFPKIQTCILLTLAFPAWYSHAICAKAQTMGGSISHCRNGMELAAAIASPEVSLAVLSTDVLWRDDDFVGYALPIIVARNLTISGSQDAPQTFNMNKVKAKVQLASGVIFTLRWLVLVNWRASSQARSFEFIASGVNPQGSTVSTFVLPTLRTEEAYLFYEIFYPVAYGLKLSESSRRPVELPGVQLVRAPVDPPTNNTECSNSSDASPLKRCLAYASQASDFGGYAFSTLPGDVPASHGYLYHMIKSFLLILKTYPEDCIMKLGPVGCGTLYDNNNISDKASSSTPAGTMPAGPLIPRTPEYSEPVHSKGRVLLATILGSVLGGISTLAGVLLLMYYKPARSRCWCYKRKLTQQFPGSQLVSHHQGATAADEPAASMATVAITAALPEPKRRTSNDERILPCMLSSSMTAATIINSSGDHMLVTPSSHHRADLVLNLQVTSAAAADQMSVETALSEATALQSSSSTSTLANSVLILPKALGHGAFGSVYEGVYRGMRVAVKVMSLGQDLSLTHSQASPAAQHEHVDIASAGGQRQQQQHLTEDERHLEARMQHVTWDSHTPNVLFTMQQQTKHVHCGDDVVSKDANTIGNSSCGGMGSSSGLGVLPSTTCRPSREVSSSSSSSGNSSRQQVSEDRLGNRSGGEGSSFAFQGVPTIFEEQQQDPGELQQQFQREARQQAVKQAAMLTQEVEILGRCSHPNIVQLLAACVTPPRLCLVLELMETSLQRVIYSSSSERGVLLPLPKVLHIAVQVCQGLAYLHPTIVHRDLKPENVLLSGADGPWPVVKLADFGLSRIRMETVPTLKPQAGTPAYIAPECLDTTNNMVTHHADMYSLGVLLWSMISGDIPWKDVPLLVMACKVASGMRLSLQSISDDRCPPRLRRLICWCWEQDPQRRPAAAEALLELQQQLLTWAPAAAV